jgi:hypothetical protein
MIISKSRNFVFIHLEKCGGTSIEVALEPYLSWDDMIVGSTDFGTRIQLAYVNRYGLDKYKDLSLWKHSDALQIKKYLGDQWNSMFKFATVRDPIQILISLYYYSEKIILSYLDKQNIENFEDIMNNIPNNWITDDPFLYYYCQSVVSGSGIDGFVRFVIEKKLKAVSSQTSRLDPSVNLYDIAFISESWESIINKIGIYEQIIINKENASPRKDGVDLNKRTKSLIKKHFHLDYKQISKTITSNWE